MKPNAGPLATRRFKRTRASVEALKAGPTQRFYWDIELRGFGVCVNANSKTYVVQRTVGSRAQGGRRTVKVTIGRHGVFSTEDARREAREILTTFARGGDPRATRRSEASKALKG